DDVSIEDLDINAAILQLVVDEMADRGLTGSREPGEPEREALASGHQVDSFLYAFIMISATSSLVNSGGGLSPAESISRTFVPDRNRCASSGCGQVLAEAIPWHSPHQKVCSKNSGVIPSSIGSTSSKISWAS